MSEYLTGMKQNFQKIVEELKLLLNVNIIIYKLSKSINN